MNDNLSLQQMRRQMEFLVRKAAKALPKAKQQEVLAAYIQGGKPIEEIALECGVTLAHLVGVVLINSPTGKNAGLYSESI